MSESDETDRQTDRDMVGMGGGTTAGAEDEDTKKEERRRELRRKQSGFRLRLRLRHLLTRPG